MTTLYLSNPECMGRLLQQPNFELTQLMFFMNRPGDQASVLERVRTRTRTQWVSPSPSPDSSPDSDSTLVDSDSTSVDSD